MGGPRTEETGVAARMLVSQMQRERRSFWGILAVFFLLLTGIGGMLGYQIFELRSFTEQSRAKEFAQMGLQSRAMTDVRSGQNEATVKLREAANQTSAAQQATSEVLEALRKSPDALASKALGYAREQFLGKPLNQSTATIVTAALGARLTPGQKALLDAALLDWSIPSSMLTDTVLPEQFPRFDAVQANAAIMESDPDPAMKFFSHAAKAAYYFRRASNGGLLPEPKGYMAWDNGCEQLVKEATDALAAGVPVAEGASPAAIALNLRYWRGQCWRRHGEPRLAFDEFQAMMRFAETDALPPSNPLKYQAYHGMGTVMTTLLNMDAKSNEERKNEAKIAEGYLRKAGDYRKAAGSTEVGEISSKGNIGFLLLKGEGPEDMVKALEHTLEVDETLASTWNLVAQLAIVRSMQGMEADAQSVVFEKGYTEDKLNEIAIRTLAELAFQDRRSLPKAEFENILDEQHHGALKEAIACTGQREKCYAVAYPDN